MNGYEFSTGWFQDVHKLIEENDTLFATKLQLTRDKIVELRGWEPSLMFTQANFDQVLAEMNIFYVPKVMEPGPVIVFPQRDLYGNYRRARVKPVGWELILNGEVTRYPAIGIKQEFKGPAWLGNSREMLVRIIKAKAVLLVEGPFDILAVRLLYPELPVLSAATDYIGSKHWDYLRILGVRKVYVMFDQDAGDGNGRGGAGTEAMNNMVRKVKRNLHWKMAVQPLVCPAKDPSKALESYLGATKLRMLLGRL
jgi:hypothetical protein